MAKVAAASVAVRPNSSAPGRRTLDELVMAWARDSATGQPRYIGEIDGRHRGGKCGCECPSCGLPVIAVNAAKEEVQRRPHFRHPEGAQRDDCAVLAARAAALRLLIEDGYIQLPRRTMSAQVVGLSGAGHEAWAELPARRVRVSAVDFRARAFAVLTLDDGRQLRVLLTGHVEADSGPTDTVLTPCIAIDVEGALAGLDATGIRQRLSLLPEAFCWHSHWEDDQLRREAERKARAMAVESLDWPPDGVDLPPELGPQLRRETLLHYEVKRILERAGQIAVPGFHVAEELRVAGLPVLRREHVREVSILYLEDTRLETRLGATIPDVIARARTEGGSYGAPLLIEVTVTNAIGEERQQRISSLGVAALEIDLSRAGGRVTRTGLHHLVVHDVTLKRWLFNPEVERLRRDMWQELADEVEVRNEIRRLGDEHRARVMAEPLSDIAERYLAAAERLFTAAPGSARDTTLQLETARHAMAACVQELQWRGFPEAGREGLLGDRRILSRLLSIKRDRGVGYGYGTGFEVLNSIRQFGNTRTSEWTLYLIAVKAYAPTLTDAQRQRLDDWRMAVVQAVRDGNVALIRDDAYDRLLSLLFPEMAEGLAKPFGKRPQVKSLTWNSATHRYESPYVEWSTEPAAFLANYEAGGMPARRSQVGDLATWALRGAELEAWKNANPEAAKVWGQLLERIARD